MIPILSIFMAIAWTIFVLRREAQRKSLNATRPVHPPEGYTFGNEVTMPTWAKKPLEAKRAVSRGR